MIGPSVTMRLRSVVVMVGMVVVSACAKTPVRVAAAPAESFNALVEALVVDEAAANPVWATSVGIHTHDIELDDYSRAAIEARDRGLAGYEQRLAALEDRQLTFEQRLDRKALLFRTRSKRFELTVVRSWEQNPMGYASLPGTSVDLLMKRNFAPAPERARRVVARLRQIPRLYAQARENLKNPPPDFTDLAIRLSGGSVDFYEKTVPAWGKTAVGDDAVLGQELVQAAQAAASATRAYVSWLKTDLLPRSQGNFALGEHRFLKKLELNEMITEPLDTLLARGEAQLERDHAAFVETARKIDPRHSAREVMGSLAADHPTAEELLPAVRGSLESARAFVVEKDLVTIPNEHRPIIEETPPFERSGTYASIEIPGAFEPHASEAFFNVTPPETSWDAKHVEEHLRLFNRPVVNLINIHEVWPGHFLQFLYEPMLPSTARKLVHASSNEEGWAHYSEQMMLDQGFGGDNPRLRLGQLSEALLRDCRYVVGIKLHTAGMTIDEGKKMFVERCFSEPSTGYEETRRGTYDPTYLYYTYGKIEIQKLAREYVERHHGTLKDFHNAFVKAGFLPLPLARQLVLR